MRFRDEDDAWAYWQYCYDGGPDIRGLSFDDQVNMFWEWVEGDNIQWRDYDEEEV